MSHCTRFSVFTLLCSTLREYQGHFKLKECKSCPQCVQKHYRYEKTCQNHCIALSCLKVPLFPFRFAMASQAYLQPRCSPLVAESKNQSAASAREEPAAAGSQSVSLPAGSMAKRQEERASSQRPSSTPTTRHRLRADETCDKTERADASLAAMPEDGTQNRSEQYLEETRQWKEQLMASFFLSLASLLTCHLMNKEP